MLESRLVHCWDRQRPGAWDSTWNCSATWDCCLPEHALIGSWSWNSNLKLDVQSITDLHFAYFSVSSNGAETSRRMAEAAIREWWPTMPPFTSFGHSVHLHASGLGRFLKIVTQIHLLKFDFLFNLFFMGQKSSTYHSIKVRGGSLESCLNWYVCKLKIPL